MNTLEEALALIEELKDEITHLRRTIQEQAQEILSLERELNNVQVDLEIAERSGGYGV
jgi:predicted RNase H-like nuclease (RuvC/YqgF family)